LESFELHQFRDGHFHLKKIEDIPKVMACITKGDNFMVVSRDHAELVLATCIASKVMNGEIAITATEKKENEL